MNQLPIISIVTPSFKQGAFIKKTLNSIFEQAGKFYLDLQVFDAISNDGTEVILNEFNNMWQTGSKFELLNGLNFRSNFNSESWNQCAGISYRYKVEKDKGQSDCINKGWKSMIGDFYAYMNSDDIYYPGAITRMIEAAQKHPQVSIFYGAGLHIDTEDKVYDFYQGEAYKFERMHAHCIICQPTVFLRKTIYQKYGGLREDFNYCMDYEYWLRLRNENFLMIPHIQAATRLHLEAKTISQVTNIMNEICKMQKEVLGVVSDHWIAHLAERKLKETHHSIFLLAGYSYKRRVYLNLISFKLHWEYNRRISFKNINQCIKLIWERYAFG